MSENLARDPAEIVIDRLVPEAIEPLLEVGHLDDINQALADLGLQERVSGDYYECLIDAAMYLKSEEGVSRGGDDILGFRFDRVHPEKAVKFPYIYPESGPTNEVKTTEVHLNPKVYPAMPRYSIYHDDPIAETLLEKQSVIAQGIMGAAGYVVLVEAGIVEKPDVIYGHTNPTMARAAERFGLIGHAKQTYLHAAKGIDIDLQEKSVEDLARQLMGTTMYGEGDFEFNGEFATMLLAGMESRVDDPLVKMFLGKLRDTVLLDNSYSDEPDELVYGTYEEFKTKTLDYYKNRAPRVIEHFLGRVSRVASM